MPATTHRNSWYCVKKNISKYLMRKCRRKRNSGLHNIGPILIEKMNKASVSFDKSWRLISGDFNHTKFYVLVDNYILCFFLLQETGCFSWTGLTTNAFSWLNQAWFQFRCIMKFLYTVFQDNIQDNKHLCITKSYIKI